MCHLTNNTLMGIQDQQRAGQVRNLLERQWRPEGMYAEPACTTWSGAHAGGEQLLTDRGGHQGKGLQGGCGESLKMGMSK